jgi:hypothetical protein
VRRERLYAVSVSTSVSASSNSRYGSATTASKDSVFGVVHEILLAEKPPLNRAKGLGSGHHDECLRVQSPDGQEVEVQTYIADRDAIDDRLKPYTWYNSYCAKSLEPASPAVPTAAPDQQHYDNDDQKSCGVHIVLLGVIRDRHIHLLLSGP